MGCTQSKIENEEAVSRCKDRKLFMKEAVSARNAFAAAHSSCAMALKNTGASLSDYAQGEVPPNQSGVGGADVPPGSAPLAVPPSAAGSVGASPPPPSQTGFDTILPPPPLPNFPAPTLPLQRAASMPDMKILKPEAKKPVGPAIIEEDDEIELEAHDNEKLIRKRSSSRGERSAQQQQQQQQQQQRRKEEEAAAMRTPQPSAAPQMMQQDSTWDYFFPPVDSMPGPTLAEPVEEEMVSKAAEEAVERKVFEEKAKKIEEEELVVEEKVEKAVEVPLPVPIPEKKVGKRAGGEGGGGRRVGKVLNLMQLFLELDDHFLKASQSAHEVSKMLEAARLHYHSNFADNRGHIDHHARVMRVITWNRSFKGIPNVDDGKDDFDSEEHETHATVLDKMLAWEKKLYDEVKAGELMKYDYQKKVALLNRQKKRGANSESLEKLKAAVSHLHTRYIVDMQSMDSTVLEINRLRDEQLYPKLVQLVDGMSIMWEMMQGHHEAQSKIVNVLRAMEIVQSPKETSEHHHEQTFQLWVIVQEWHDQFCKLIGHQKEYIKALTSWLKLNLIPIESNLREKVSSPLRVQEPPIQALLTSWNDYLDKLPDEVARTAIKNFAAVIHTIFQQQEEEMKLKDKCEDTRKELTRKTRQFEDWYHKYMQRRTPSELDSERAEDNTQMDAIGERQLALDTLKKHLEDEEEEYQKQCLQVREKSLASLKTRLPELFSAMSDIARACSYMYRDLSSIAQRRN